MLTVAAFVAPALDPGGKWPFVVLLVNAVLTLVMVEQLYRGLPNDERWGFKPICFALSGMALFELYFFADALLFGSADGAVWSVRGLIHVLTIPLIAMSAARVPDWNVRIAVSRDVMFHSTALAVAGGVLLLIAAAGYYLRYVGGTWGQSLQVVMMAGGMFAIAGLALSGRHRARLRVWVNKHLFPYRYDYRAEWQRFTHAMSTVEEGTDLGEATVRALGDLVESPGGQLWLRNAEGVYLPAARVNRPLLDVSEPAEGSLVQFLAQRGWIIDLDDYRVHRQRYAPLTLPEWLPEMPGAWLVVPLTTGGDLLGFVVLAEARAPFDVDWEVRDLLKAAQRQAAGYLAHRRTTEALVEARQFAAFSRMSSFVVHDLKNLVAQLSLMLKNADRHGDNPEFQRDMLETVTHVEARMRSLMAQLQNKVPHEQPRRIQLAGLLSRLTHQRRHMRPSITLEIDALPQASVLAHPEQLERVLGHLINNALEASDGDAPVRICLTGASEAGQALAVIEVIDRGCGMPPRFVQEQLMRPFATTKPDGMGLGVFEARQVIAGLGGRLSYRSEPAMGTTVRVVLPLMASSATQSFEPPVSLPVLPGVMHG